MKVFERNVFGINFKNPVMNASGCLGFGLEMQEFTDVSVLGGLVTKAVTLAPRSGNPQPRIAEFHGGMINSIGLENPGVDEFRNSYLPQMDFDTVIMANVAGRSQEEYEEVLRRLKDCDKISAFEINVSCPNAKGGIEIGVSETELARLVKSLRSLTDKPLIIKLSPLVTDIAALAHICENEGADGLTLINTLKGVAVDWKTGKPLLGNTVGGISGPCLKPLAIYCIYKVREKVKLPVIGCGGISSARDVMEFLAAGASLVQTGTAAFKSPFALKEIIEQLNDYSKDLN